MLRYSIDILLKAEMIMNQITEYLSFHLFITLKTLFMID